MLLSPTAVKSLARPLAAVHMRTVGPTAAAYRCKQTGKALNQQPNPVQAAAHRLTAGTGHGTVGLSAAGTQQLLGSCEACRCCTLPAGRGTARAEQALFVAAFPSLVVVDARSQAAQV
jgi:hypothetical protein